MEQLHEKLLQASFRGVKFFIPTSTIDGGRKVKVHEYPNRDDQYVEDLGLKPKKIKVTGRIYGGLDFLQQRESLIAALDRKGIGTLVHPWYGAREVVLTSYSISEKEEDIGCAEITLEFEPSIEDGSPEIVTGNGGGLSIRIETIREAFTEQISEIFKVSPSNPQGSVKAQAQVGNILSFFSRGLSGVTPSVPLSFGVSDLQANYRSMIFVPQLLFQAIEDIFFEVNNQHESSRDQYQLNQKLTGYTPIPSRMVFKTVEDEENEQNQQCLTLAMSYHILLNQYEVIADYPFETSDELLALQKELDTLYLSVVENLLLSADLRAELQNIRSDVTAILNEALENTYKILSYYAASDTSSTLLSYLFYGNTDLEAKINELNGVIHPAFVRGNVKLLSR